MCYLKWRHYFVTYLNLVIARIFLTSSSLFKTTSSSLLLSLTCYFHVWDLDLFCFILLKVQGLGHVDRSRLYFLPLGTKAIPGASITTSFIVWWQLVKWPLLFVSLLRQWPSWPISFLILLKLFTWLLWSTV